MPFFFNLRALSALALVVTVAVVAVHGNVIILKDGYTLYGVKTIKEKKALIDDQTGEAFITDMPNGMTAIDVAAIRIDHRRRSVGTAIARVVGRKDRAGRRATVGVYRRSSLRPAVARIIRRNDWTGGCATVGINRRSTRRPAIARIIR